MEEKKSTSRTTATSQVLTFFFFSSAILSSLFLTIGDSLNRVVVVAVAPLALLHTVFYFVPFSQAKIQELEGGGLTNTRTRHLAIIGHILVCVSVLAGGLSVLLPGIDKFMLYIALPLVYLNFTGKVLTVAAGRAVGERWSPLLSSFCDIGVLGLPILFSGNVGFAILSSLFIAFLSFALFLRYLRALASAFKMERQIRLSKSLIPGLLVTSVLALAGVLLLPDSGGQYLAGLMVTIWLAAYLYLLTTLGFAFSQKAEL